MVKVAFKYVDEYNRQKSSVGLSRFVSGIHISFFFSKDLSRMKVNSTFFILLMTISTTLLIAGYVSYKGNLPRVTFPPDGKIRYLLPYSSHPENYVGGRADQLTVLVHCYNMDVEGEHLTYEPVIFAKYFFDHANNTSDGTINSMSIHFLSDLDDFYNVPYYHDEIDSEKVNSKKVYSFYIGRNRAPEFNVLRATRKTSEGEVEFEVPEHILSCPIDSSKYERINLRTWKQIKELAEEEWRRYNNE